MMGCLADKPLIRQFPKYSPSATSAVVKKIGIGNACIVSSITVTSSTAFVKMPPHLQIKSSEIHHKLTALIILTLLFSFKFSSHAWYQNLN